MPKRISILARILEKEKLSKEAQEATPPVVDQTTADKVALEAYKKIFDAEWDKIIAQLESQ